MNATMNKWTLAMISAGLLAIFAACGSAMAGDDVRFYRTPDRGHDVNRGQNFDRDGLGDHVRYSPSYQCYRPAYRGYVVAEPVYVDLPVVVDEPVYVEQPTYVVAQPVICRPCYVRPHHSYLSIGIGFGFRFHW